MIYTLPAATVDAHSLKPHLEFMVSDLAKSADHNMLLPVNAFVTDAPDATATVETDTTQPTYKIQDTGKFAWTKKDERVFLELAKMSAMDKISTQDSQKLEELERIRNVLNSNRSYREILAEKRQFEKADKLIQALNEYLETTH